jgi:hypothetical protein
VHDFKSDEGGSLSDYSQRTLESGFKVTPWVR